MESLESKKIRGGYYTPIKVAKFIAKFCIQSNQDKILEPSAGDGNFISAVEEIGNKYFNNNLIKNICAVEINPEEASKIPLAEKNIHIGDFFNFYRSNLLYREKFDVILGNPPFIRYQNFESDSRNVAFELMNLFGLSPNKLTNIWVPFLILSAELLSNDGRIGMIIPAELMQVNYAKETREYLLSQFDEINIITFNKNIFINAQQEVVILLAKKKSFQHGFRLIEVETVDKLNKLNINQYPLSPKIVSDEKWIRYLLPKEQLNNYTNAIHNNKLTYLNDLVEVNVGVVTGQNKFFVLDKETVDSYHLQKSTINVISRAAQLKGLHLTQNKLNDLYSSDKKVKLFKPSQNLTSFDEKYIKYGEKMGYQNGYKTRIRDQWYQVPISWKPDAFFLRQVNKYPRIIINETNATSTDTIHKIRVRGDFNINDIAISFLNSLTYLQSELIGRSYGGGVLTFEPSEVRNIKIPLYHFRPEIIQKIELILDSNKIEDALAIVNQLILIEYLGFSKQQVRLLTNGWLKLRNRRLARK